MQAVQAGAQSNQYLLSQEATNESIPSSICVHNLLLWNGSHREGVKFSMLDRNDRVASLSDHHQSAAAAVLLSEEKLKDAFGNFSMQKFRLMRRGIELVLGEHH